MVIMIKCRLILNLKVFCFSSKCVLCGGKNCLCHDAQNLVLSEFDIYTAGRSFFAFSSRVKAPAIELAGEGIVLNSIQSPPPPVRSRGFDAEENAKNDRPAVYFTKGQKCETL
jgi:hypothetical protein